MRTLVSFLLPSARRGIFHEKHPTFDSLISGGFFLRHQRQPTPPRGPGDAVVTPGEFRRTADADQPGLRVADRRRRQSQREGRRLVPQARGDRLEEGDAAAAPAGRAGHPAERVQPGLAEHVRRQHPRSRAGHGLRSALRADRSGRRRRTGGERDQDGDRAHAPGAEAGRRAARSITSIRSATQGRSTEPSFTG